jgi:NAD(P)-dependent dehydrogenase (short-subunit alcohol dehydrogenase family)
VPERRRRLDHALLTGVSSTKRQVEKGASVGRLSGKVAIVTGGGTGIGRATACLYAEEGAKVVIGDVRPDDGESTVAAITEAGGEARFVETDVSKAAAVEALVAAAESEFGALHVMTANAGILGRGHNKSLVDLGEDEIDQIMSVNFMGVVFSFKYAIPAIRRSGGGAMTATASISGHRGYPKFPAYCASKAAVLGLVRSVAADVMPEIRVNAVSPGTVATMIAAHTEEEMGRQFVPPARSVSEEPYARRSDPRELAHAHLWLVSDDASSVSGQALVVDNGRTIVVA